MKLQYQRSSCQQLFRLCYAPNSGVWALESYQQLLMKGLAYQPTHRVWLSRLVPQHLRMSPSLNSLKGILWGTTIGVVKGDTRSLDSSSHRANVRLWTAFWVSDVASHELLTALLTLNPQPSPPELRTAERLSPLVMSWELKKTVPKP